MKIKSLILCLFLVCTGIMNAQNEITKEEKLKIEAANSVEDQVVLKEKQKMEADRMANQELILGLPKISEKTLFIISETSLKINGLQFVGFCDAHKLGMFKYSKTIFQTPEDVIKAFEKENIFMPMLVKEGSIKDVEEMCSTK